MSTPSKYLGITADDIRALRSEACAAGDSETVELCDAALENDIEALASCEQIIAYARMRADEEAL